MIPISDNLAFDEGEVAESFIRASGPGGQNVNKVASEFLGEGGGLGRVGKLDADDNRAIDMVMAKDGRFQPVAIEPNAHLGHLPGEVSVADADLGGVNVRPHRKKSALPQPIAWVEACVFNLGLSSRPGNRTN